MHSGISHLEYRKKIHEIQMKCLNNISTHVIYNYKEIDRHNTFDFIHPTARGQILSLDDDDVLIPLDDDDWLSPEIKNVDFNLEHMTIWNTVSVTSDGVYYHKKNTELQMVEIEQNTKAYTDASGLLSNCGAYKIGMLKTLIAPQPLKNKKWRLHDNLDNFLQLHTRPRHIIRAKEQLGNFRENILDDYLAIYVRHAGNVTGVLSKLDMENVSKNIFDSIVAKSKIRVIIPKEFSWAQEYLDQLYELNLKL